VNSGQLRRRFRAALGGGHGRGQGALDRADAAVEGQLAHGGEVLELLGQELAGGDEQAQGDGQVEAAGALGQVGRGEVDDGAAGVAVVAEVDQGALDAVDALLHDADEGKRVHLGEHTRTAPGRRVGDGGTPEADASILTQRAGPLTGPARRRWALSPDPCSGPSDR
jgi:hypothetical protein